MNPLRTALAAQVLGGLATLGLTLLLPELWRVPLGLAAIQGASAAVAGQALRSPPWWLPIHLGFLPLTVLASRLELNPAWYLGGFLLLLAIFWRTDRSRVPLYLSNEATATAIAGLLPAAPARVLDLGCGDGRLLRHLARRRPDCQFVGVEHAPLPWLLARLANRGLANCQIRFGDFWMEPLGAYDLVYAFLSPVPMTRLWQKAAAEMKASARLVSNSFPVPGQAADETAQVPDRRATKLYCYRPANR